MIPSVLEDVPIPIDRIPRHQGTDYAYIKALAARGRLRLLHRPGPGARHEQGVLGPGDPGRRAAARAQPRARRAARQREDARASRFDKEQKELPVVFIQEPTSKVPIPIPIPDITPLNPPLGVVPPLPPKITFLNDTAKLNPLAAAMRGLAYAGQHSRPVFGTGSLDVARYGHVLQVAPARRRARRGRGVRRPALRHVGDLDDQARRVHAVVLARPQRPALDAPGGAGMSSMPSSRHPPRAAVLRQVPRHGRQQRRPDADRADPGDRARRLGLDPDLVGDAVPARRRDQHRRLHRAADRLRRLDRVRAGRPGLPDLGRRLLGHGRRGAGARAHGAAGGQRLHDPDDAEERDRRQRRARARPAGS